MNHLIRPICVALLGVVLSGCNLPQNRNAPGQGATAGTTAPTAAGGDGTPAALLTPTSASSPTPLPPPPAGWVAYNTEEVRLTVYHPEGWQAIYNDHRLDLRAPVGEGWAEIQVINTETDDEWGLSYMPGMDGETIINVLLAAARQDGEFEGARPITTRSGQTAWVSSGVNNLLPVADHVFIGVISGPGRAILLLGHAVEGSEEWPALADMYEQMVWSLELR